MAEVTASLMTLEDIDAVERIEQASFAIPWSRASLEKEVTENACARYVVLREAGEAIAYAGVWFVLDEGHITNIAVRPDRRGMGYGERVTRALIQLAADSGMTWMTLEVRRSNIVAQNLYRKLGFEDVGYRKCYYADTGEDALVMCLEQKNMPPADPENDPMLKRV